jgi:capsular exopolysaccharide synthesis family protein
VAEPFSTLYSSLQLKDQSKSAKCFLVTSTIASEGKSFIATTLAATYGKHGERVVVVDCDLRRPSVHRIFQLENLKGVIDVANGEAVLDDVLVKGVRPNVDVVLTGGRAKNPSQILNSREFALMVSELRKRYDRVFIDSPPLAPVSDALMILPLVDGSLYAIYFNKVRRKAAQFCAKRLTDANVPNFGAILNGLNLEIGGMYYAQYGKSYREYYAQAMTRDAGEGPTQERGKIR